MTDSEMESTTPINEQSVSVGNPMVFPSIVSLQDGTPVRVYLPALHGNALSSGAMESLVILPPILTRMPVRKGCAHHACQSNADISKKEIAQ